MKAAWSFWVSGTPLFKVIQKLKILKQYLTEWGKVNSFHDIEASVGLKDDLHPVKFDLLIPFDSSKWGKAFNSEIL